MSAGVRPSVAGLPSALFFVRRTVPSIWFGADSTSSGRDAISWYHEKQDTVRGIGLGPSHDWSSHAADAFGLMCVAYEEPMAKRRIRYSNRGIV